MGKQVNFYMTAEDEQEFLSYVRSDRDVGIFKFDVPSTEIPFLNELPPQGEPFWAALWLWDRDHSPRPVLTYVERQKYYAVEESQSEVIEFHRCGLDEGRLVRGRIWAEMNGWHGHDPATIIRKSDAFRKWYDRLAKWIKRRSTRDSVGDYMLPGAAAFAQKGGRLCQAVFADGTAI